MNRSSGSMRASGDRIVSGRFQLVRQLGEGGMGVVWEALDLAAGEPRAIKLVHPDATDSNAHPRFVREAEVLRGIAHPNVVRIFEIARDDDGAPAIVMELLRGESLAARIEREKTLTVGQTCAILSRVTAAVAAAHAAGIIHRDLKPDNVFVVKDAAGGVDVRVLDFGVARKIESTPDKLTKTGTLIGTPYYMSPEQASGLKDLDGRSDVWSLAVITFECLTGKMPIRAENYGQLLMQIVQLKTLKVADLRPDVPKALTDAIDAAFVDRETRIGTGQLASVFVGLADNAIAPPPAAPAAPTSTRTLRMGSPATPSTPRAHAAATSHPLDAATLIDPQAPRPARGRGPTFAIASLALLALGGAGLVYRARIKADADSLPPAATTTATTTPTLSTAAVSSTAEPSAEPTAPPQPAASTTTAKSAAPSASTAKKVPTKPVVSAASTGHATPPPTTTDRLQGGVGGNVPF